MAAFITIGIAFLVIQPFVHNSLVKSKKEFLQMEKKRAEDEEI